MRKFLFFLPLSLLAWEITVPSLVKAYKRGAYKRVCLQGYYIFDKLKKDENLLSMYAFSCLRSDYINRLAVPILILGKTPESRKNRSYFSLILAQKNLLISALADKEDFSNLKLPNTNHLISKVFNLYFQKKFKRVDNIYTAQEGNVTYEIWLEKTKGNYPYLVVEVEKEGKKRKHIYK
ncbi:MAG: hypothetical protein GXO61_01975 [Epsilonproteobacteria bacterium]|nr:hypothetical protein [Campylobacterota bacterium]